MTAATPAKYADDCNGDGYRDYAFGDGGDSVTVIYGTATGSGTKSKRFTQNSAGIPGTSGDAGGYADGFGGSLANADLNRDGYGDLAVSDIRHSKNVGSVVILRGNSTGPMSTYSRLTQATSGVATNPTTGDGFGYSLSAGDTNRDGYPDLAVSAVSEKVGSVADAGGVHVLRGSRNGLTGAGSKWFTRATAGVRGTPGSTRCSAWASAWGTSTGTVTRTFCSRGRTGAGTCCFGRRARVA